MTIKIKERKYLVPPKDLLNDALDVFVTLDDDYCTDGFCYFVEVTTPEFFSTLMEKKKMDFLSANYPFIIVSKLTYDIIKAAIESFISSQDPIDVEDELYWLKLYHLTAKLGIDEILYRKKQEELELNAELGVEFEDESDRKDS